MGEQLGRFSLSGRFKGKVAVIAGIATLLVLSLAVAALALNREVEAPVADRSGAAPAPTATPTLASNEVWYPARTAPVTVTGGVAEYYNANGREWMRNGLMTEAGKSWLGPRNGGSPIWVSFLTDAPTVEPVYLPINGRIRHMVDGKWVNPVTSLRIDTNDGFNQVIGIKGPKKMHRIDLRLDEAPFSGLSLPPGYTIKPAPAGKVIAANIGDSYSESNMSTTQAKTDRMEGQIYTMARALGIEKDIINDAIGGRGYTNNGGGTRKTFLDSVLKDFVPLPDKLRPNFFTIWGGYNDGGATQAELGAAAAETYAAIDENFPGVPVFVIFSGDRPEPEISQTQQKTMRDTIKAAALEAPNVVAFIDGVVGTWYPGALSESTGPTASPSPWLTSENVSKMIGSDKVHGTPAYHQMVGPKVAAAIREASGGTLPGA